jgi:tetratricopeptide (TPR) repeat protein
LRLVPWLLFILGIPCFAAEVWTLPLFSSDAALVFDTAQKFAVPPSANVYLIDLNVRIRVDPTGRESEVQRFVFWVSTEAGAKTLANLSTMWLAWRQEKPLLRARVITPDKQAHMLDPATVTEAGVRGTNQVYSDSKILQAPLPAITPGSVVECEIEVADREAVMPGQRFDRYPVTFPYPIHHAVVEVEGGVSLRAAALGFEKLDRKESKDGDTLRVRFEVWEMQAHKAKVSLPPELPAGPEILVSTAASWQAVARWYAGVTEPILGSPQGVTVSAPSETELSATIGRILADVQAKVRYTGLELGMAAYVPGQPAVTLARGYGDCKDKAALLASQLRAAGIPAQLALLTPYPSPDVVPGVPGLEAFSHAIVYIPGVHSRWIDPSSQYTPATRIPLADQGRNALLVDADSSALIHTPESTAEENSTIDEMTIKLPDSGKATMAGTEVYSGGVEDIVRATFALLVSAEQRAKVESAVMSRAKLEKIASLDLGVPADIDRPFRVKYTGEGWEFGNTRGETADVYLSLSLAQPEFAGAKEAEGEPKRVDDYYLAQVSTTEVRKTVIPPSGFQLKHTPDTPEIEIGPLKLSRTVSTQPDGSILATSIFTVPRRRYTAAEAREIEAGMEKLSARAALHLEFVDQAQALLSAGKEKQAIAMARDRARAEPTSVAAALRFANTLSAAGAHASAIEVSRQATKLDPKSALAFAGLADLYARDWTGRAFREGMQYAEAFEPLRHAIELDPKNTDFALQLATLDEHDAHGVKFSERAHMAEAVSALQVEADLPKIGRTNNLAEALLFNRDFAAVKSYSEKEDVHVSWSYRLAAIAATDGADAAKNAFDRAQTTDARQSTFRSAASSLIVLGEYAAAAGLLREVANSESDIPAVELDLLSRTRRPRDALYSDDARIALTQRLIYALLDVEDEESWKKLCVPEWRGLSLKSQRLAILRLLQGWRSVAKQTLGWTQLADVAVSNGAFAAEGSDATGYRVRMADLASNGAMKTISWIEKRGSEYQIVGLAGEWATAGGEALKAAQAGDLKTATQWLDWLREDQTLPSGADSQAGLAFTRLWPSPSATPREAAVAGASLAARGLHWQDAMPVLSEAQKLSTGGYRDAIDLAILQGYASNQETASGLPEAMRLNKEFPESDSAFTRLLDAYIDAGQIDLAAQLTDERLSHDPTSTAALRGQARVYAERQQFSKAVAAMRQTTRTSKVAPNDWNLVAWYALFAGDPDKETLEAASTATRLTQTRNAAFVQTLGCVQAELGDTAGARRSLNQYLDLTGEPDGAAYLLHGLILEQLGLPEAARADYRKIERPKRREATSSYALAQGRLTAVRVDGPAAR